MCIISVIPAGLILKDEIIDTMWNNNSDGAGFMYAENDKLHVYKGLMTLDAFKEAYEPHKGKKLVLHFRIKTHGEKNAVNTHPFNVDDTLAFVHNGVVTGYGSTEFSDTYHFNEELIKPLRGHVKGFLKSPSIQKLLEEHIGYSKMVFLNNKGDHYILNEKKGETSQDGIWFSNGGWQTSRKYYGNMHTQKHHSYLMGDDDDLLGFPPPEKKTSVDDNVGNRADKSITPAPTRTPYKSKSSNSFDLNELVYLSCPGAHFKGTPKNTLGRVGWFTGGYVIAVNFGDKTDYIPAAYLDRVIPIRITKNYGHLRIGYTVLFSWADNEFCNIIDPENLKEYAVPNNSWESFDDAEKEVEIMLLDATIQDKILEKVA